MLSSFNIFVLRSLHSNLKNMITVVQCTQAVTFVFRNFQEVNQFKTFRGFYLPIKFTKFTNKYLVGITGRVNDEDSICVRVVRYHLSVPPSSPDHVHGSLFQVELRGKQSRIFPTFLGCSYHPLL